jgi:ATP-dependent DNA ligase
VVVNQREIAGNLFTVQTGPRREEFFRFCSEKALSRFDSAAKVRVTPLTRSKDTAKRGAHPPRIREHDAWRSAKPVDSKWLLTLKYNGVRVLAIREGDDTRLFARGGPT